MGQWSRKDDPEPFIDLVPMDKAQGLRKVLYEEVERVRGKGYLSNLFKAYSAFPQLGLANFRRLVHGSTQAGGSSTPVVNVSKFPGEALPDWGQTGNMSVAIDLRSDRAESSQHAGQRATPASRR